jgi:hypothetical protein
MSKSLQPGSVYHVALGMAVPTQRGWRDMAVAAVQNVEKLSVRFAMLGAALTVLVCVADEFGVDEGSGAGKCLCKLSREGMIGYVAKVA